MRALHFFPVLALGTAISMFAEGPIILGARGGLALNNSNNLTNPLGNYGMPSPGRQYIIGGTAGVRLPLGFSIVGDALFNRQNLNLVDYGGFNAGANQDSWQFPVMLNYTFGHAAVAPVIGAGFSVRHLNNFGNVPSYVLNGSTSANSVGFVVGGGVRFKAGPVDITPELRYTHWASTNFTQDVVNTFLGTQNEASVTIGFTF